MTTHSASGRMWWLAGVLGLLPLLIAPMAAFAIFPPVVAPPHVTTIAKVPDPPVKVQGDPGTPVVEHPTATTPEPTTLATAAIGIAFGVILLRRKKTRVCGAA